MENASGSGNFSDATTARALQSSVEIASQPHWIISLVVSVLILLTNLWIAIGFYHHAISKKILKKKKSSTDVNGGLVMMMAMAAVVVPFFRYIGTLSLLFVSLNQEFENGCEIANDICVVGFVIAVLPTYAFLWARQRAFYGHPSLDYMFGRCVSVFSHICIVLIVLASLCALALGVYPEEYEPGKGGCTLKRGVEQGEFRTYIYAIIMISSQLILLGLFLHPIRIHVQQQRGSDPGNVPESKGETTVLSSNDGFASLGEDTLPGSVAADDSYHHSAQTGNNNQPFAPCPNPSRSPGRSLSVPSATNICAIRHLRRISDQIAPDRKYSAPSNPETEEGKAPRAGKDEKNRSNSNVAIRMITKFKKKVRQTTMVRRRVYRLIKRVLCLTIISVLSDLTVMMINAFVIPDDIPQTYSFVLYDFNLLINVATVVLSFENWREMMLPQCQKDQTYNC